MKKPLGFGCMRLPVFDGDMTKINIEEFSKMADRFLEAGFTYFDTSYVYHGGASENAVRQAVVERHPRNSFTVATKFPTWDLTDEKQLPEIFEKQLKNLGVDYIDYYLLHNIKAYLYDDVVEKFHAFDFVKKMKAEGKIKHIGFSYHASAELLDRILTEHPEVEFVQIVVNYYDWDSPSIQSRKCYETIRKHGKQVVIMEPVKGGTLSTVPKSIEDQMKKLRPNDSISSWAVRFAASLDGVLAVLSGMSSLEQVDDNAKTMNNLEPVTDDEKELLKKAVIEFKKTGPLHRANYDWLENKDIAEILDAYNSCQIQPIPTFAAELNYYKNTRYNRKMSSNERVVQGKILDENGNDITDIAKTAEEFVDVHSF